MVKLSNGSERVVPPVAEGQTADLLMEEIETRQFEYEWLEDSDGRLLRVEAIDEMWVA